MKTCPTCGSHYPDDANFCPMDAARLVSAPAEQSATVAASAASATPEPGPSAEPIAGRFVPSGARSASAFGPLFAASDTQSGNAAVLVQLVEPRALPTPAIAERVLRELRQLAKAKSERILRVVDQGKLPDGCLYIATEDAGGASLELLVSRGPLSLARARSIVLAVGDALVEAQKVGVIHRDLSPRNILVTGESVKLGGFGLAEPVTDKVFGTPAFLSPEQAEGKPVDQRSNIYSLGVLLYYMITGRPPFEGDAASVVQQHLHAQPTPPSGRRSGLPPEVDRVVLKALEKSGGRRHLTLRQLINEIDALPVADEAEASTDHTRTLLDMTVPAAIAVAAAEAAAARDASAGGVGNAAPAAVAAAAAPAPVALATAAPAAASTSAHATVAPAAASTSADAAVADAGADAGIEESSSKRPTAQSMPAVAPDAAPEAARTLFDMPAPQLASVEDSDEPTTISTNPLGDSFHHEDPVAAQPAAPQSATVQLARDPAPPSQSVVIAPTPGVSPAAAPGISPTPASAAGSGREPAAAPRHMAKTIMMSAPQIPLQEPPPPQPPPQQQPQQPRDKKGFRETAWFKRGEIEEEMARKAAEMASDDPLAVAASTEAVVDDSTLTAEDRARLSLKSGRMASVARPNRLPVAGGDTEVIAAVTDTRKWLYVGGGVFVALALFAVVYFLFVR